MLYPPGPRSLAAYGFLGRGSLLKTLGFLERTARQYGPISYFRVLHQRIYLIDDPELIKEVLVTRQHDFTRDTGATLLREVVGDAMITRDEPEHKERRRILQPAFHREQIEGYATTMAAECDVAVQRWTEQPTLDLAPEMRRLTLAIVGAALFDAEFHHSAEQVAEILRSILLRARRVAPFLALLQPFAKAYRRHRPDAPSLLFRKERRQLEAILDPVIANRRRANGKDIISLLLATGELRDEAIRNEVVTFVLAGHETTASALTWAFYLIAKHPEVRRRLEAEVDSAGDYSQLPYTARVFQEAMRLYPPAAAYGRKAIRPVELGGYTIPAGSSVILSPYVTHRNPLNFPNPEDFNPDRWLNNDARKFAYFPFGGGAKMCIGDQFAKMEGVIAIAATVRHLRFSLTDTDAPSPGEGITLQPSKPIILAVELRSSKPRPGAV